MAISLQIPRQTSQWHFITNQNVPFCVRFPSYMKKAPFHLDRTTLEMLGRNWLQVEKNQSFAKTCQRFHLPSIIT